MRKGPLKLYLLIVSCSCDPVCGLSGPPPVLTAADYILVAAAGFAVIHTDGVQNPTTVMVFSFAKFPSKTLNSFSFFSSSCSFACLY